MFNSFYGMTKNPFDKQQIREEDCYRSNDFEQMTARLNFLKDTRGIGVFTASPGMGKSYALRCFAKSLNPNQYHMEYICLSTVSVSEFYKSFCQVLGVNDKGGKTGMFKSIQDQIWLVRSAFHYEAIVNSRGTYFHVIVGRYRNGNFLCVPNHNFGCELSQFTDTLLNAEKLRRYLNPTDTESLVCAIRALTKFNEDI